MECSFNISTEKHKFKRLSGRPENKITHAAWQGVECMEKTIENFTGIEIDYHVKMNFKGVVSLVDALGGIPIYIEKI